MRRLLTSAVRFAVVSSMLAGTAATALAQSSSTDQGTPSALAKGSHPLSSFSGGGLDTVNLYNGNLAFRMPAITKNGRAGMGYTVPLAYNSKIWRTIHTAPNQSFPQGTVSASYDNPDPLEAEIARGWRLTAGRMRMRRSGIGTVTSQTCPSGPPQSVYSNTLTTLTFSAPDGTEYTFRDEKFDGAYRIYTDACNGVTRGTQWYTTDGTGASFASDDDTVKDIPFANTSQPPDPPINGVVYLRDGSRFKIQNNLVVWQQDRNGNRINHVRKTYTGYETWTIYDTLGRVVTVTWYHPEPAPTSAFVAVTVDAQDANGVVRTTKIWIDELSNLRDPGANDGDGIPTMADLWEKAISDGLNNSKEQPIQMKLVSRIELPLAGFDYAFKYNKYGELSRIELPTGGRIDYTYDAWMGTGEGMIGAFPGMEISRGVRQRFTYTDSRTDDPGRTLFESKTAYETETYTASGGRIDLRVLERFKNRDNTTNAATRHWFYFTPETYYGQSGFAPWNEGKEYQTQFLAENATTVLRETETGWDQRSMPAFPLPPENDPRVNTVKTTLRDSAVALQSKTVYAYDDAVPYNNVDTVTEYDYAPLGSTGSILQQIDRDYVTDAWYVNPIETAYADSAMVHMRSLLKTESVKRYVNSAYVEESRTAYTYDEYTQGGYYAQPETRTIDLNPSTPPDAQTQRHNSNYNSSTKPYRGNVTTVVTGVADPDKATSRFRYDVCGNVVKSFGPRSTSSASSLFTTDFEYSDDPDSPGSGALYSFAYPTAVTRYVGRRDDGTVAAGDPLALKVKREYSFGTGQLTLVTGENGETTSYSYKSDGSSRLDTETRPPGYGSTTFEYSGPPHNGARADDVMSVTATDTLDATRSMWTKSTYDGLGRAINVERSDADVGGTGVSVSVARTYDARGRVEYASNPYRSTETGPGDRGWTKTTYDALGRVRYIDSLTDRTDTPGSAGFTGRVESIYNDAPVQNRPLVRVKDQALRQRASASDALGRLTTVFEPNAWVASGATFDYTNAHKTDYAYGARGDLTAVTQGTGQAARQFTYDGLGRLRTTLNPETGSTAAGGQTTYDYDLAGNLTKRTEPRSEGLPPVPVYVEYEYDELDRLLTVNYSTFSAARDVRYVYDTSTVSQFPAAPFTQQYLLGRTKAIVTYAATNGGTTAQEDTGEFFSYEQGGRVQDFSQLVDGAHHTSTSTYNDASLQTLETYSFPGSSNLSRAVDYNEAGQPRTVSRGTAVMAGSITYRPSGALASERFGDPASASSLYHTIDYNSRLQPRTIALGSSAGSGDRLRLDYTYGVPTALGADGSPAFGVSIDQAKNNGNVARITVTPGAGTPFEQNYLYDELNRITLAREYFGSGGGSGTCSVAAPTAISAVYASGTVTVTFTDNSTNETGFRLERRKSTDSNFSLVREETPHTGTGNVTLEDTGSLEPGGTYVYQVIALGQTCNSAPSNSVSVSISIGMTAPVLGSPVAATANRVDLTWTDNNQFETSYSVFRKESTAPTFGVVATIPVNSATYTFHWSDSTVLGGRTYQYYVVAYDSGGANSPNSNTVQVTTPAAAPGATGNDTIGTYLFSSSPVLRRWAYRNSNSTGSNHHSQNWSVTGITAAWVPVAGDFNGDGNETFGYYDPGARAFYLTDRGTAVDNSVQWTPTIASAPAGCTPIVGNWDGINAAYNYVTVGAYDPVEGKFYLKNSVQSGATPVTIVQFGPAGSGWIPLAGDWDNDNVDTIGLYDPVNGAFFLKNSNTPGPADIVLQYGPPNAGWLPIVGDWNGDGQDTVGLFEPVNRGWYLKNTHTPGAADVNFFYGAAGCKPVVADWDNLYVKRRSKPGDAPPDAAMTAESTSYTGGSGDRSELVAGDTTWSQEYEYDRWSNMRFKASSLPSPTVYRNLTIAAARNRITAVDGNAVSFDDSGNVLSETVAGRVQTYSYSVDNRMWKAVVSGTGGGTIFYFYDGAGRRVKKQIFGGDATRFVYNAGGQLVAEYTNGVRSKEYVYGPSGLLAVIDSPGVSGQQAVKYVTPDHLGTPRVVTRGDGTIGDVLSRHDYLPFGEELTPGLYARSGNGYTPTTPDGVRQRFTSKERDAETGLDFFLARQYLSSTGRFMSSDPITLSDARVHEPQRWNLYSYAGNNPLANADPTGMDFIPLGRSAADIDSARRAVEAELKRKGLDKARKSDLEKQKDLLELEAKANRAIEKMLKELDKKGELGGLKITDFVLSTNPTEDFKEFDSPPKQNSFMFSGKNTPIFIDTTGANFAGLIGQDLDVSAEDWRRYAGTAARHEQIHQRGNQSEVAAYTLQKAILQKFGPKSFKTEQVYQGFLDHVEKGIAGAFGQ